MKNAERKRRKEGKRKEALVRVKQREVVRIDGKKPCSFVDLKWTFSWLIRIGPKLIIVHVRAREREREKERKIFVDASKIEDVVSSVVGRKLYLDEDSI